MKFGLIIVGDEILSGKRADAHLSQVIQILAQRGLSLSWAHYVGDDPERMTSELITAFASGDIVFSCGGIGATPDDHTRACAAQALKRPLQMHEEARALILQRCQEMAVEKGEVFDLQRDDQHHRLNMAMFPEQAELIPNPYNKIAGFFCYSTHQQAKQLGAAVYFVPGFPVMAWPMIEWVLDKRYSCLHQKFTILEKSVIVMGAMEASLTPLMLQIENEYSGIKVFSLPSVDHPQWGRHVELGVKSTSHAHLHLLDPAYRTMMKALKDSRANLGEEIVR
jgi:molybdopterin-biosynthesis enzyme MoeA-like protein